jgi:hypothetical protein
MATPRRRSSRLIRKSATHEVRVRDRSLYCVTGGLPPPALSNELVLVAPTFGNAKGSLTTSATRLSP